MGVTVDWANDSKTILCYTFAGNWDWDAFYVCWDWVREALEASDHKISVILDFQATRHIPPNSLVHLRSLSQNVHPNYSGATAYVGVGALGALYKMVLEKVNPEVLEKFKVFFVPTPEEAIRVLDDWNAQQKGSP